MAVRGSLAVPRARRECEASKSPLGASEIAAHFRAMAVKLLDVGDRPRHPADWAAGPNALMPLFRSCDGLPDLGAAVRALIDEVDLRHAPMGLDFPDIHGKQSHTAGADDGSVLALVMLNEGWHVGSPLAADAAVNLNPEPAYRGRRQRLINSFERNENRRILSAGVAFL